MRDRGISIAALRMPRGRVTIEGLRQLRRIIKEYRPHVVQTRLDHANLVGGLMTHFTGAPPVVWAVHSTDLGPLISSWKTRIVRRLCAQLSRALPRSIVSDARSSAALHEKIGFSASKLIVIPNGVDPTSFRPDLDARERMRRIWGVTSDEVLLGCVARWDPLKDHENLVHALKEIEGSWISFSMRAHRTRNERGERRFASNDRALGGRGPIGARRCERRRSGHNECARPSRSAESVGIATGRRARSDVLWNSLCGHRRRRFSAHRRRHGLDRSAAGFCRPCRRYRTGARRLPARFAAKSAPVRAGHGSFASSVSPAWLPNMRHCGRGWPKLRVGHDRGSRRRGSENRETGVALCRKCRMVLLSAPFAYRKSGPSCGLRRPCRDGAGFR